MSRWLDTPQRYGLVTRMLHWTMAALLSWQFAGMAVKNIVGRHPLTAFMVGSHKPIGTLLLLLVLLRGAWGLSQWARRPPHPRSLLGRGAAAGHALLYALMAYIPAVALLREAGSGRGFAPFGIPVFAATGQKIEWMLAPANLSHGVLAWTLCALIVGHVLMVALHQLWMRDGTLARMAGPLRQR
ncbi:cytochrome b [Luteimonas yindakuii]|uniref:Cytochrome b n=1 Tax=Luteimonas yindakuii TaxID=2565782 RepID=A0A4Z1R0U0_9GAMM|nr:cytochrome b [Luteimonas yindakuii]QCO66793.1 cytochrome b [Luteimonas yindakuii]TKS53102.1 cytochrome b [Luteimonas yindakuii]